MNFFFILSKLIHFNRTVGQEHCIVEESNGQLAGFFDWVKPATYEGQKKYHEISYDLWGYTVRRIIVFACTGNIHNSLSLSLSLSQLADIRYEVAVKGSTPVLFNRYTAEYFVLFSIGNFNATTPPADMFAAPKECTPGTKPQKLYKPHI